MVEDELERRFFHSFPRPKSLESADATLDRGLSILATMKDIGLVLAPELLEWDISGISGTEHLRLLQRRACFTELSPPELPEHGKLFGPISLSFETQKLRAAGAMPVIYAPQGQADNVLSQISTFCVRGAYHTQQVLRQLQGLKENSDPALVAKRTGLPVSDGYLLNLRNSDKNGRIVAAYEVPARDVASVLSHVGFNNIPFDHSIGVLEAFLHIFYPTDNIRTGAELAYYRQREWRLIGGDLQIQGRPIARPLTSDEAAAVRAIDPSFWDKALDTGSGAQARWTLAQVYDPIPGWNLFDLVEAVYVPVRAVDRAKSILGPKLDVRPSPEAS